MRSDSAVRDWPLIVVSLAFVAFPTTRLCAEDETRNVPGTAPRAAAPELPPLFSIAPGTRVDDVPPSGWSHLVLKSIPRLASGDLDTLPESAQTTATLFRSIILADVRRTGGEGSAFALRCVGVGICLPDRGHDRVVTSDSLQALGIQLSTIPKIVLGRTETEMAQARLVARTPTFAVLRSPVLLLVGGKHQRVLINYALLVDPRTGSLHTLVWWTDADPSARKPARDLVLLQPAPLVFSCNLDVVAHRLLGEIPVSWSFAMAGMPPGQAYPMPSRLQSWSANDPRNGAESAALERDLWNALSSLRPVPDPTVAKTRVPVHQSR